MKEVFTIGEIKERIKVYAPVHLKADISHLSDDDKDALEHLVEAARLTNEVFWRQNSHDGIYIRGELNKDNSELAKAALELSHLNAGPYDIFLGNKRFIGDGGEYRYPGGAFYPEGMKKEELETYIKTHPDEMGRLLAIDTVVRKDGDGFNAVNFAQEYSEFIEPMCNHLEKAADKCTHKEFSEFLRKRANALRNGDDLYDTDVAWLNMNDNPYDICIGPIETYGDELFGAKASYQGMVMVKDPEESRKLQMYKEHLTELERSLPLPEEYLKSAASSGNRIEVHNAVYFGGDARYGGKPMAHNLPNNEKITAEFGNKNQMFKNIIELKAEKILKPIARLVINPDQLKYVTPEAFFNHTILHELGHTLGPSYRMNDGKTTIKSCLKDLYTTIEECKADTLAMFSMIYFREKGIYTPQQVLEGHVTQIASMFRSMRFGMSSAHAKGNIIQIQWLMGKGGIVFKPGEGFTINLEKFESGVKSLAKELLETKLNGDYTRAKKLLDHYGVLDQEVAKVFDKMGDIPIDIYFRD